MIYFGYTCCPDVCPTGLTRNSDALDLIGEAVAKVYRVYYAKVREEGADADDYLMDHASITCVMGPDGKYLSHFSHDVSPKRMAERLNKIVAGEGA